MTVHPHFLELAAAAIDFELDPAEQEELATHLAACTPCRRRAIGLQVDARAARELPAYVLAPERAQRIWRRIDDPRRGSIATLRLVAIAALLVLAAVSAVSIGASLLRRDDLNDAVTPPRLVDASATASPSPAPQSSPQASAEPRGFAVDTVVEIVVSDLRVRTAPTVDNTVSAKLEPLLGVGTRLQVIDGPVFADDYEWYLVQAIGWPHRGWVAAADHDGEPWIEDPASRGPSVAFTQAEQSIIEGLRADAAVGCAPRTAGLPTRAVAGVDCRLNTALVVRVGGYLFENEDDAAIAYLERLRESGVTLGSGECASGSAGDRAWTNGGSGSGAGPLVAFDGAEWAVSRIGCFLDQYGTANVRATCGRMYVGILGRNDDLGALHEWVWQASGEPVAGAPPGICEATAAD
ncbi:MAG TPA: hypothetical protein VK871_08815 [Candidatus Limnocylindrales bacterium]|nr:hypothetical protein [Candidatus Limnocylindrales bacterium]